MIFFFYRGGGGGAQVSLPESLICARNVAQCAGPGKHMTSVPGLKKMSHQPFQNSSSLSYIWGYM